MLELGSLKLTTQEDDIISVMRDLYVKTPEALERLLNELREAGYTVDNLREAEHREGRATVEEMEKNGWSLWYASIRGDISRGKCNSCSSYISRTGIQTHGHTCEVCGEVTYLYIVDGTRIRFEFLNDVYREVMFAPQLNMTAQRWDTEEGYVYFYWEFHEGGLSAVTGERAEQYLAQNSHLWEKVEEDGKVLLKVRYPNPWRRDDAAIEPYESYGHYSNYQEVKVWKGQEYREWDHLPVPESMSIYESWHWAPVPKSPTIHRRILSAAGQTDDKGWFHQDGRPWFTSGHWQEMSKFVRHFTELDGDAFDRAWPSFRKDGPGGIDSIARFCHESPIVTDRPNMMNSVNAIVDAAKGKKLTRREIEAAEKGTYDPNFKKLLGYDD